MLSQHDKYIKVDGRWTDETSKVFKHWLTTYDESEFENVIYPHLYTMACKACTEYRFNKDMLISADDVVNETMLKILTNIKVYLSLTNCWSYLFQTMKTICWRQLCSKRTTSIEEFFDEDGECLLPDTTNPPDYECMLREMEKRNSILLDRTKYLCQQIVKKRDRRYSYNQQRTIRDTYLDLFDENKSRKRRPMIIDQAAGTQDLLNKLKTDIVVSIQSNSFVEI